MSDDPWAWPEERWRAAVGKVRAGRSLKPAVWPNGAKCAVALSFDSDHETLTLRTGQTAPGNCFTSCSQLCAEAIACNSAWHVRSSTST